MHTQNTLHLTDKQYDLAVMLMTFSNPSISDDVVVKLMVREGIRQYPAEQLIQQRAKFQNDAPLLDDVDLVLGRLQSLSKKAA